MKSMTHLVAHRPGAELEEHPPLVEMWLDVKSAWPWFAAPADGGPLTPEYHRPDDVLAAWEERLGPTWRSSHSPGREPYPAWSASDRVWHSLRGDQFLVLTPQSLRFVWNGRDGERYPHYETIRDGLVCAIDAWQDVWESLKRPISWSGWCVQYVNALPQGTVWQQLGNLKAVTLLGELPAGMPTLCDVQARWHFRPEPPIDSFTIELTHQSAGEVVETAACLWLALRADGVADGDLAAVLEGLDAGRQVIVSSFKIITSKGAHHYWGLSAP
ncbi:MAG: hypothetical protein KatS3mg114_0040 [Planctomycetaceae bacterium]|nr:MAG: hypothetical protein KatS3mg114_0040 [Planctomycetaceae bacterium]